jgi:4-hydroxythreonine-4-phosphate dehydrogenase
VRSVICAICGVTRWSITAKLSSFMENVLKELPLAVSLGDPSGVGPEVVAKAWVARDIQSVPPFFAVGDARAIEAVWRGPMVRITDPSQACEVFNTALPIIQVEDGAEIKPGSPNLEGARCALDALEMACGLARSSTASGLVTGPVAKSQLYAIGFRHPGQTEFVAERCGMAKDNVAMMLAGPTLRVVLATIHVPISEVPALLSIDLLLAKGRTTAKGLQRNFGICNPRIAFAGLNPHGGEHGEIGREEIEIIAPAVELLKAEGIDAFGPVSPDALFHKRARAGYDAVICMYHDQGLIPLKALHFDDGVNITLGLPIVRTSPDHGTAFDIAGTGQAEPGAMIAAIKMAASAAQNRADCA